MSNRWIPCICLVVIGLGAWSHVAAQVDLVIEWVSADGTPACDVPQAGHTLHVSSWVDGVTQTAIQGADLVVDSTGQCQWNQVESGTYTLEALPLSWTFLVEPWDSVRRDTVTLVWSDETITGLRGNEGAVAFRDGHPGEVLSGLQNWMNAQLDSLDLDQWMATGAVGAGEKDVTASSLKLKAAATELDSILSAMELPDVWSLWGDLLESQVLQHRMSLGVVGLGRTMDLRRLENDPRSWEEKLASPGWCSTWEMAHESWWEEMEENRQPWRSWVAMGDTDSLTHVTGWSLDELHVAMWLGQDQSWSRWAEAWWGLRWRDQCAVAEVRRQSEQARQHPLSAQSWADYRWMMPNGDLEAGWAGGGGWKVWLVTRSGSASALRELAILRSWMESQAPVDVSWGVLSVDFDEEGWTETLRLRKSVREEMHWVGRDPGWWDRLDMTGVPQVIVAKPNGEIQTHHASLPSEGLFAELKRWRLTEGPARR